MKQKRTLYALIFNNLQRSANKNETLMKIHILTITLIVGIIVIPYAIGELVKYLANNYGTPMAANHFVIKWVLGMYSIMAALFLAFIYYIIYNLVKGTNKHL